MIGVDLDGVVADFYRTARLLAAEWRGVPLGSLSEDVGYGLREWGFNEKEYVKFHRFAVLHRNLFLNLAPIVNAPQCLNSLRQMGIRVRLMTHRLYVDDIKLESIIQTAQWLNKYRIYYDDLCFVRDKEVVEADWIIEDSPVAIHAIRNQGRKVIVFTNSTNIHISDVVRVNTWPEIIHLVATDMRILRCREGLLVPHAEFHNELSTRTEPGENSLQ